MDEKKIEKLYELLERAKKRKTQRRRQCCAGQFLTWRITQEISIYRTKT